MRFPNDYPPDEPPAPPPPSLADQAWASLPPETRNNILREQRLTKSEITRTKATLVLHQLDLDHQAEDQAARGAMPEDAEGWHDQSMARFDARAMPFLASLPDDLKAEFAPRVADVRDRRSTAGATEEYDRRTAWAMNTAQILRQAGLDRTAADPDSWAAEHALYAGHVAALPLLDKERPGLIEDSSQAFRGAASHAYVDAGRDDDALAVLRDDQGQIHPQLEASMRGLMLTRDLAARQKAADDHLNVTGRIYDDLDSMRQTGTGSPDLSAHQVKAVLGDEGVGQWLDARHDAQTYHASTADLSTASSAELAKRLQALQPAPGTEAAPDDQRRQQLHAAVSQEVARVKELRATDPAAAVREIPGVKRLAEAADPDQPETVQALAKATLRVQQAAGVPIDQQRVLTNDEAETLAAPLIEAAKARFSPRLSGQPVDPEAPEPDLDASLDSTAATLHRQFGPYAVNAMAQVAGHAGQALSLMQPVADRQALDDQGQPVAASDQVKVKAATGSPPPSPEPMITYRADGPPILTGSPMQFPPGAFPNPIPELPPGYVSGSDYSPLGPNIPMLPRTPAPKDAPYSAVLALRKDPSRAAEYDRKYGQGAAAQDFFEGAKTEFSEDYQELAIKYKMVPVRLGARWFAAWAPDSDKVTGPDVAYTAAVEKLLANPQLGSYGSEEEAANAIRQGLVNNDPPAGKPPAAPSGPDSGSYFDQFDKDKVEVMRPGPGIRPSLEHRLDIDRRHATNTSLIGESAYALAPQSVKDQMDREEYEYQTTSPADNPAEWFVAGGSHFVGDPLNWVPIGRGLQAGVKGVQIGVKGLGLVGKAILEGMGIAGVTDAATQGVRVANGHQDKFSVPEFVGNTVVGGVKGAAGSALGQILKTLVPKIKFNGVLPDNIPTTKIEPWAAVSAPDTAAPLNAKTEAQSAPAIFEGDTSNSTPKISQPAAEDAIASAITNAEQDLGQTLKPAKVQNAPSGYARFVDSTGNEWLVLVDPSKGSTPLKKATEGVIYYRIDKNGKLEPYVGQAESYARYLKRQSEHNQDYSDSDFDFEHIDSAEPGVDLDVAEHQNLQAKTGGVSARHSPDVSNKRDPVGQRRRKLLGLPEPSRSKSQIE